MKKVLQRLAGGILGFALVLGMTACGSPVTNDSPVPKFETFGLASPEVQGVINHDASTVDITVPSGTDVTALVPVFALKDSSLAEVALAPQVSGETVQNFSSPVTYRLIGGGGVSKEYVVTVTAEAPVPSGESRIQSLTVVAEVDTEVLRLAGIIDDEASTVSLRAPAGLDLQSVKLDFSLTAGAAAYVGDVILLSGETQVSLAGSLEILVVAADSSSKTYTLTVTFAPEDASDEKALEDLTVGGVELDFSGEVNTYTVEVPADLPSLDLSALPVDSGATVLVNGKVLDQSTQIPLVTGTNTVVVTVIAENGTSKEYLITVVKAAAAVYEAKLLTLGFNAPEVSGIIDEAAKTVAVSVPHGTSLTALPVVFTLSSQAVLKAGDVTLVSGESELDASEPLTLTVVPFSGDAVNYVLTVTAAPAAASSDSSLKTLKADGTDLGLAAGKTEYSLSVAAGTSSIKLLAETGHGAAVIQQGGSVKTSGTEFSVDLEPGSNRIEILVTAEDGSSTTYAVVAKRAYENKMVTFGFSNPSAAGRISQTTGSIDVTVPFGTAVDSLVAVFTASAGATVESYDVVQKSGVTANDFTGPVEYVVTNPDGGSKVYRVTVTVAPGGKSSDANLLSLAVQGYSLDYTASVTEYELNVPNPTASITLTAVPNSAKATVQVNGGTEMTLNLEVGLNTLVVQVVAEDGSTKSYTLKVRRAEAVVLSLDSNLASLALSAGTLSPAFSPSVTSYTASVANSVSDVTVTAAAAHSAATVAVSGGQGLTAGAENLISITVTAENGSTKVYAVKVTRAAASSSNSKLTSLGIQGAELSPAFSSGVTKYTAAVANSVTSAVIDASAEDSGATVTGAGEKTLAVGLNTFTVTVSAADKSTTLYTLEITRAAPVSSNADLAELAVSGAELAFKAGTADYAVSVANSVSSVTISAKAADAEASVTGTGAKTLNVGSNSFAVKVTAKDGSVKTYNVVISRAAALATNAELTALSLGSAALNAKFDSKVTSYTASVANGVSSLTVTAQASDSGASVAGTGAKTLNVGENTITVTVTAADGVTKKSYTVKVTRAAASGALVVTVTDKLALMTIQFSGWKTSLSAGESMTITATVSEAVSKYTWYLNGLQQASTTKTLTLSSSLAAGSYSLDLVVENASKLASGTVKFSVSPALENGTVNITIDSSSLNMYAVEITGGQVSLEQGKTMTLTASAALGADSYQWYMDGKAVSGATSSTYTVPGTTALGFHRVDVMAKKGTKLASAFHLFTVTSNQMETVATPTFSVPAGEVASGTAVSFASTTAGVTFHYTLDGTEPTTSSTSGASVTLTEAKTVKVMAVKSGMNNSAVASASYTIKPVTGGITIQIPATYGEDAIHYWSVTATPAVANSVWATPVMLTATETGWKGYTLPNATAAEFLIRKVGGAQTPNQKVTAAGVYYMHHNGTSWVLSTTKPTL